jgi:hypothetical protein
MATRRLELGMQGAMVLRLEVEEPVVGTLTQALSGGQAGWTELPTEDGSCWVNLASVVYMRVPNEKSRGVGFSGA